ncbi:Hypothetical protein, putative [Bodo saltans]|uniref:Uncharacterized protein n=1 Tax=Bodo saltans TaxID=75058 RepID=A0A0S4KHB4_BODSA|nr:Hypothetical protein, putative [Bodo saltans]|eukprot:CUI15077.1 Hypothetical protein, putative [Bodo saltans]
MTRKTPRDVTEERRSFRRRTECPPASSPSNAVIHRHRAQVNDAAASIATSLYSIPYELVSTTLVSSIATFVNTTCAQLEQQQQQHGMELAPATVEHFSCAIASLTAMLDDDTAACLVRTSRTVDAIIALSTYVATAQGALGVSRTLCNLISGASASGAHLCRPFVRDTLVGMSRYATTPDAVRWVSNAISHLANVSSSSVMACFYTPSVLDALLAMSQYATTHEAVRWLSNAFVAVTRKDNVLAMADTCVGSLAVRDALVAMAQYATTPDAARWVANAICNVTTGCDDNPPEWACFCTDEVRYALLAMAKHATTPDAARWVANAVCNVANVDDLPAKKSFCAWNVLATLETMSQHATTPDAVQWVSIAMCEIMDHDFLFLLSCTAKVRDALVAMSMFATTPEAARWVAAAIYCLTLRNEDSFTSKVLGALITMSQYATTAPYAARSVLIAICKVTQGVAVSVKEEHFATPSVLRVFLELAQQHAITSETTLDISRTLIDLVNSGVSESLQAHLCSSSVRDVLVAISQYATTPEAALGLCAAMGRLAVNKGSAVNVWFCTSSVRDALVAVSPFATTPDAAFVMSAVFFLVTHSSDPSIRTCFCTPIVRDALVAVSQYAATPESAQWVARAICTVATGPAMTCDEVSTAMRLMKNAPTIECLIFRTSSVLDALMAMSQYATTPDAVRWMSAAFLILARKKDDPPSSETFSFPTFDVLSALVTMSSFATTPDSARWVSQAIRSVARGADRSVLARFDSPSLKDALAAISHLAAL